MRAQLLRHFISLMKKAWLSNQAERKIHGILTTSKKTKPQTFGGGNSNASDLVKSIFADPEALQLLRSAFINPLNSGACKAPYIEPEVQIIDAGATKAHKTARRSDETVSDEAASTQTAKRPRLNSRLSRGRSAG